MFREMWDEESIINQKKMWSMSHESENILFSKSVSPDQ